MVRNLWYYDVFGQNSSAGVINTTWKQRNIKHEDRRERRIFRFEKTTREF
jgi:hypothetical protein